MTSNAFSAVLGLACVCLASSNLAAQPGPPRGHALRFSEGSRDDFVKILDSPSLHLAEFTIEMWVRPHAPPTGHVFGKAVGGGVDDSYVTWVRNGGATLAFDCNVIGNMFQTPMPFVPGEWTHIAAWNKGCCRGLVINGVAQGSVQGGLQTNYDNHPLIIGADINQGQLSGFFRATIDEVRVWDHSRTTADVRRDMSRRLLGTEPGLVSYWRFDDASGQLTFDSGPAGNHGSLGGTLDPLGDPGDPEWIPICYADFDWTTGPGILDIFDFLSFQDAFVRGEQRACDCDTTTGANVCDIFDFLCFQGQFVFGCP